MSDKKILEIDKYEQGVIITSLNSFRSDLIKENKATDIVDEIMLKTAKAPNKKISIFKKEKKKCCNEAR